MEAQTGFIHARLASATTLPAEQRRSDVSAFIECCALQQELLEAVNRPGGRWSCAEALKLARSQVIGGNAPLLYAPEVQQAAVDGLFRQLGGEGSLGQKVMACLRGDTQLKTVALVVAGLRVHRHAVRMDGSLLPMLNEAVALLQQQTVRRQLQRKLAAQERKHGRPLLSYEQLLGLLLGILCQQIQDAVILPFGADPSVLQAACQTVAELAPRLAPDNARLAFNCTIPTENFLGMGTGVPLLRDALRVAEQQGSDLYISSCAYVLVHRIAMEWELLEEMEGAELGPPSAALALLAEAEAARRRGKGVLPKQWTSALASRRTLAMPVKPWLEQLQREGDHWRPAPPAVRREVAAADAARKELMLNTESVLDCCSCGGLAAQLRTCGGCNQAQYCRCVGVGVDPKVKETLSTHDVKGFVGSNSAPLHLAARSARSQTGPRTSPPAKRCERRQRAPQRAPPAPPA